MSKKANIPAPPFKTLLTHPALFLGFGLGSGLITPAPGTWGTLFGLILFIPLLLWQPDWALGLFIFSVLAGSWICGRAAQLVGVHDHGGIVWDEFAGIWLVLLLLPQQTWPYWLAAFISFRVFDIVKPWPISWVDQKVPGGTGIMLDDLIAGLFAIGIIWLVKYSFLM